MTGLDRVLPPQLNLIYGYDDLARKYLNMAIEAGQNLGMAYLALCRLENDAENMRISKKYLAKAEQIARRTNDSELAYKAQIIRFTLGTDEEILNRVMSMRDPEMVDALLSLLNDDMDDFFDD